MVKCDSLMFQCRWCFSGRNCTLALLYKVTLVIKLKQQKCFNICPHFHLSWKATLTAAEKQLGEKHGKKYRLLFSPTFAYRRQAFSSWKKGNCSASRGLHLFLIVNRENFKFQSVIYSPDQSFEILLDLSETLSEELFPVLWHPIT